ncbi:MAG TPA: translation initiation factor IF-3 [Candidatus Elarobacter sp.]
MIQYASRSRAGRPSPDACGRSGFLEQRGLLRRLRFFHVLSGDFVIARPLRVNEQIRIRQVRVIDDAAQQLGVMPTEEALNMARSKGLDLIEVSPTAIPPVCRIGDYGRLKYEQSKKDKEARKKQRNWELREVKLRPKIDVHDYEVKAKMAERLLLDGGKVKVTIMFRGREITYTAFGKRLLDRVAKDLENSAIVEREAKLEGKNMFLIMAPRATPLGPPRFVHLKTDTAHHEADTVVHAEEAHHDDVADVAESTDTTDAVANIGGASA